MLTQTQRQFAQQMVVQANRSGHIWPNYAAAEACVESAWGVSELCQKARNVFGLKAPSGWAGDTLDIPTKEYLSREWVTVPATWPIFGTYADAFTERMQVLRAVGVYRAALLAPTGPQFITQVSQHWSTSPTRAQEVLEVYSGHPELFAVEDVA